MITFPESCHKANFFTINFLNLSTHLVDPIIFLAHVKDSIKREIVNALDRLGSLKINFVLHLDAIKQDEKIDISVKTTNTPVYKQSNLEEIILFSFESLILELLSYAYTGSGWSVNQTLKLELKINKYIPLRGAGAFKLPVSLRYKSSLQNITTKDKNNDCFRLAIYANYMSKKATVDQINRLDFLDFSMCRAPVEFKNIPRFEKANKIAVSVFGYENNKFFPIMVSKFVHEVHPDHVHDLLFLSKGDKGHYINIRDINACFREQITGMKTKIFICRACFSHYYSKAKYDEHVLNFCKLKHPHVARFPEAKMHTPEIRFRNYKNAIGYQFKCAWDSESVLIKVDSPLNTNLNAPFTHAVDRHVCIAISCIITTSVSREKCKNIPLTLQTWTGYDCAEKFMKFLDKVAWEIKKVLEIETPLKMTAADERNYAAATCCKLCGVQFNSVTAIKCRHHDHGNGKFLSALCSVCNQQVVVPKTFPIICHNIKYDMSNVVRSLFNINDSVTQVISKVGKEDFIYMRKNSTCNLPLIFTCSYLHSGSSLNDTANSLPLKVKDKLKLYLGDRARHAFKKGHFPFNLCSSIEEMRQWQEPPPREAFFSPLKNAGISEIEYLEFQNTWRELGVKDLFEWLLFYLSVDTYLLMLYIDHYEEFVLSTVQLSPWAYVSLPSLTIDAALLYTKCKIENITDPDMYFAIKQNIKGGLTTCNQSFAIANNPECPNYDETKIKTAILTLDFNQLYSCSSQLKLPCADFKWDLDLGKYNDEYILNWDFSLDTGCFLFISVKYPKYLHDRDAGFPLLSVRDSLEPGMEQRLLLTLEDQENYFCHVATAKQLLTYGLKITRVNKVITFTQRAIFKSYLEFCVSQRQNATSQCMSNYQKLAMNSLYGRMLYTAGDTQIKLCHSHERAQKLINKSTFKDRIIYSDKLISIISNKTSVLYKSPVACAATVLEFSKIILTTHLMEHLSTFSPWHETILLNADTDGYTVLIKCENVNDLLRKMCMIETSNYPVDHVLYSPVNKKRAGFLQDESASKTPFIFIGLGNKCYSILYADKSEKKRTKGFPQKGSIQFKDFLHTLVSNETKYGSFFRIDKKKLTLRTMIVNKIALRAHNLKRFMNDDGITSYPPGHWRLQYPNYNVPRYIAAKLYECI